MSAHSQPRLTPEQYLKIERAAEFRSEYYNGRMFMMAGASPAHVMINFNLGGELRSALKKTQCGLYGIDFRVRVSAEFYAYPDIAVVCGEPKFADDQKDTLVNPQLLMEILSPTTEQHDRGFKSVQYRTIKSLQEYAFVSQTEPRIELYRRQSNGWFLTEFVGLKAKCKFESINCEVALAEIYARVDFTP